MPRKRKDASIPKRMYFKHGSWFYVHHDSKWERLGTDFTAAKAKADAYNGKCSTFGTMGHWMDSWLTHLKGRVAASALAERTLQDYTQDIELMRAYLGHMAPQDVQPHHIAAYLEVGLQQGRAVRANREKAALSSCMSWMITRPDSGLTSNPCKQVKRNTEKPRDRFVTDDEYARVYERCGPAERAWMELMYRTLQRPSDILRWTHSNISVEGGQRVLSFRQSKTGAHLRIQVTDTLQACFDQLAASRQRRSLYLICREDGGPYTEEGIASMFRRAVVACGIKDLAPYDMKAKGATDLYQAGTPLEHIQALCAHDSVTTTEIYIKRHLNLVVQPNERVISRSGTNK